MSRETHRMIGKYGGNKILWIALYGRVPKNLADFSLVAREMV